MSNPVTLATGEVVDSADPAWAAECLVRHRHVQNLLGRRTLQARREYLANVGRTEGAESQKRLEAALQEAWTSRDKVAQP